ncbi:probable E3 ubiquitin-protein ligase RNF144A-A [Argiope bruennichi]|uniref:probable E3 ubiquitin-protein ligase RNF144A-A n=1 Tax=Argiope bruennichi TaxID=94029 RepID=UPI002494F440|nr:probable E3 ubiquitin-protein ligase RNF144A-A [Argiope bruennichi]XP_055933811.1 probable E3 ubiquitin-protein ligase RNF144A-A [Argiope bruennichi]XP_055933812.1 probable E3 ubiquitin-protein ligase RNF144A-A [Argiope bruennichi]
MSPPNDKSISRNKYSVEIKESKQKLFSFRWLLRKSKSSKFAKETQSEKCNNVPASKSCDTGLTAMETVERCPTFLLWKLLPPGRSLGNKSAGCCATRNKLPFRSSFSCNDVHGLVSSANLLPTGSHDLLADNKSSKSIFKHPSQSFFKLSKSKDGLSHFDDYPKSPCVFNSCDLLSYTSQSTLCKLCLIMVPSEKMYTLQDCGCVFCVMCLHQYLTFNIKEGNVPVTCPDAECSSSGKILVSEIKEIAGEDALFMFERYKLNLDVDLDPTRVWCPSPGCETICSFEPLSDPDIGVSVHCQSCRLKFCSTCKLRWHGSSSCDEAKKALADEIEMSTSDDESWIKRCPNCRIPIEKDEGCAQMMCYRCKHVFCWHCLTSLDDDFLLRHYDKGPCRNKLGHSRASMIWHRTQVVGIFAGFSFLLLIASPFLLLAAPCLLCCRCKNRLFYEEATPL